jgi:hypothetical protein
MINRLGLAQLWQSILTADPYRLFGRDAEILMDRSSAGDDLPQPGFVGSTYRPGGVLFLGNNPGNGPEDPDDLDDLERRHIRALRDLKAAPPNSLQGSFEALMESLVPVMSEWGLVQKYVRPILSGADMDLDSIAYLNLFKWRSKIFKWRSTKDTPARVYRQSWQKHTGKQCRLLRPIFVVALGNETFGWFKRISSASDTTGVKVFRLKRARNDWQCPPEETLQVMPKIAEEIRRQYTDQSQN